MHCLPFSFTSDKQVKPLSLSSYPSHFSYYPSRYHCWYTWADAGRWGERKGEKGRGWISPRSFLRPLAAGFGCQLGRARHGLERDGRVVGPLEPVEAPLAAGLESRREGVAVRPAVDTSVPITPACRGVMRVSAPPDRAVLQTLVSPARRGGSRRSSRKSNKYKNKIKTKKKETYLGEEHHTAGCRR